MHKRVIVAMSGGVDSSLSAAILKKMRFEVIGITMQIWPADREADEIKRFGGCCGIAAVEDAKRVAGELGITHYVVNFKSLFAQEVIADFCREYSRGRTPNPCIRCNQYIKFEALLNKAKELDADYIATGHYARIEMDGNGKFLLKKGVDTQKDQSYFLYVMRQEQLKSTLMPLGNFTKVQTRQMAKELKLPVAERPESQEICFVGAEDYGIFLKEYLGIEPRAGPIVNNKDEILGEHKGIIFYTIGQRKRLGIGGREKPLYVIAINPEKNTVVVGEEEKLYADKLEAEDVNWILFKGLEEPIEVNAKIRYRAEESKASVKPLGNNIVSVEFKQPQRAITPGQAVVFYDQDKVIGGGTIKTVYS
jgi:tRNA-specific 2-thiouridylase